MAVLDMICVTLRCLAVSERVGVLNRFSVDSVWILSFMTVSAENAKVRCCEGLQKDLQ